MASAEEDAPPSAPERGEAFAPANDAKPSAAPWLAAVAGHIALAVGIGVFGLATPQATSTREPEALIVTLVMPVPEPAPPLPTPDEPEQDAIEEDAAEENAPTFDVASRIAVSPPLRELELLSSPDSSVTVPALPRAIAEALAEAALRSRPCLDDDPTDEATSDCSLTDDPRALAVAGAVDPSATFDPLLRANGVERLLAQWQGRNSRHGQRRNARGQLWDPRLPTANDPLMALRDARLSNSDSMRDKLPADPDPYFGQ